MIMKTTQQWWDEVSNDESLLVDWLKDQYHGEVTAEKRIRDLLTQYELGDKVKRLINKIADDEKQHAEWVKGLLESRGITAEVLEKEERYWNKVLPVGDVSFEEMAAIGHHAETMRLERIKVLAQDTKYPDISDVFKRILPDELFHAAAFEAVSTPEAIANASDNHRAGLNALGLII